MKIRNLKKQIGMSLLEVLVSILICGIGLAGMVSAIQASQRLATSAEYRAIATREIQSMVDMMRANRLGANQYIIGGSSVSKTKITAGEALCLDRNKENTKYWKICDDKRKVAESIAAQEADKWKERVEKGLPNGSAEIGASDRGGIYVFTVKITWTVGNEKNTAVENPVTDSLQMSFAL